MPGKTLRTSILCSLIGFIVLSIIIGVIAIIIIQKRDRVEQLSGKLREINLQISEDIELMYTFINYESINKSFYITGDSYYLEMHDSIYNTINQSLLYIMREEMLIEFGIDSIVFRIWDKYHDLSLIFKSISDLQKQKGFEDHGSIGEMRTYAHFLEDEGVVSDYDLLMLRRHEKDFLLRNMLKYQGRFQCH